MTRSMSGTARLAALAACLLAAAGAARAFGCGGHFFRAHRAGDELQRREWSWSSPRAAPRVSFAQCRAMCGRFSADLAGPCVYWSWSEGGGGGACVLHGARAAVERARPGALTYTGHCHAPTPGEVEDAS